MLDFQLFDRLAFIFYNIESSLATLRNSAAVIVVSVQ